MDFIPFLGKKKKKGKTKEEEEELEEQMTQLHQRIDSVVEGLTRIGVRAVMLNDDELKELYYNLYNPETIEKKLPTQEAAPAKTAHA